MAAGRAVDPAYPIQEEDADAPERQNSNHRGGSVSYWDRGARTPSSAADCAGAGRFRLEPEGRPLPAQAYRPIHESAMFF